jgi:hypothetical protein
MELFERSKRTVEELFDVDQAELGLFTDHSPTNPLLKNAERCGDSN